VRGRVIAALAAASVCWTVLSGPSALPAAEAGHLAQQVDIRRTAYGVPHIKGETLEAAAFGLGYCQAEDHLLNIMHSILRARGELAKHFGGDKNVETDFWNRQYEVHQRATATYHRLDADFRSMLEGFAAGLNYYVSLHRDEAPEWVPTVNGHDMAAHGLTGIARFAFNRRKIVDKFIENQQTRVTAFEPRMHEQHEEGEPRGSNMWSLAPSRTESGHAILMGNPHQAWSQVATYYEAHLTVPDQLNFYGSTFVGRPVLTTGWNENLGWSHTVNYPDLEEIYELDADANRADHYMFDGSSIPLRKQIATVEVQTEDGLKTQSRVFWYSPLGPVVHRTDEKIYVLKSAAYDEFRFYQQWLRMAQAKDFTEFRKALDIQAIPMFNICYADREGNIFYLWNGTVPDLPHEAHKSEAVPARRSTDVWTRFPCGRRVAAAVQPAAWIRPKLQLATVFYQSSSAAGPVGVSCPLPGEQRQPAQSAQSATDRQRQEVQP
jgi:acyl-homoserine-lactone acylase